MQFAQLSDRVTGGAAGPIDVRALPGTWRNSNPDSNGIARIVICESGGNLSLQVFAIGPDRLIDWGTAAANVFMSTPTSQVAAGFTCRYDFGFVETPFRRVYNRLAVTKENQERLTGRILRRPAVDAKVSGVE